MNHSWCNVRLSRTIMYFPGAPTWLSETRSLPRSQVSNYDVMKWYLDTVQRAENKLWDQGKQTVGFQRAHPISPGLAELLIELLSVEPGGENLSLGVHFSPERREVVESSVTPGMVSLSEALFPGNSMERQIPHHLQVWPFCSVTSSWDWIRVHDWSSGWVGGSGCESRQWGGGGHLGEGTNTRTLMWMLVTDRQGSISEQQHEENSQKEVYASFVICAQEVPELEPPASGRGVPSQICTPK